MYKNIYFLHIPKSAGRYVYHCALAPMESIIVENNIRIDVHHTSGANAHQMWCKVLIDDFTYIISSFRDPVERLVSHYCHVMTLNKMGLKIADKEVKPISKELFLEWVEENKNPQADFQAKNFLLETTQTLTTFDFKALFTDVVVTEKDIKAKLKRTNLLIRSEDLTEENTKKLRQKILLDLNIDADISDIPIPINPYFTNELSAEIYKQLTEDEKAKLYALNPLDTKIYKTDAYFWNP
jgi:Sulfotransferase family